MASGDPKQDRVMIWTALEPDLAADLLTNADHDLISLGYEVSVIEDLAFADPVRTGETDTSPDSGFTVKVEVSDLSADAKYVYRFYSENEDGDRTYSHVGHTRTLPEMADEVKLAVCSCANYSSGYFHVYRHLSLQEDLHVVLHLGDYIYESASLGDEEGRRLEQPVEARDIPTYRARYAEYRLDPDLQALHRAHPMICIWDDHEFDNNAYADGSSSSLGDEWITRKQEAKQVYHEWLPTSVDANMPLYRQFNLGGIADLYMLDTRIEARSMQLTRSEFNQRFDENRQLLGEAQEMWLYQGMVESQAPWQILGQQVMMSQLQLRGALETERERAILLNTDSWDGYAADRERLFSHITDNDIGGVVVLTGDIHTSWAAELSQNPNDPMYYEPISNTDDASPENSKGGLAVELVTPSVTSRSFELINDTIINALTVANPHFKWYELTKKGFIKVSLTRSQMKAQWCLIEQVSQRALTGLIYAKTFISQPNRPGLMRLTEVE